jgi:transcriptional regulator GlxA family with amidase domain
LDAIARAAGVAKRTLERVFHRELGRTPRQELIRIRARRAHDLLMQTDWSVGRIAKRCGYSSTMHMVKRFRREYRLSPAQYRRSRTRPS